MDDSVTTIRELKQVVKDFSDARDWDRFHGAKDLAIGMVTEASELLQEFRFKSDEEVEGLFRDSLKAEMIGDEIADTLYFILRISQRYNLDLTRELQRKMEKNAVNYPVEKSRGSNKKYGELK
ncbi:MAG: nucleotide pyrophosphohydrolase [Nitrososphaerales archaeon]|jgi:NTP pyrophosphatase (non-canonical NTP hydrolase)